MKSYTAKGDGIYVHEKVRLGANVSIGHASCIGYGDPDDGEIVIGDDVTIGAFCIVYFGAQLADQVFLDDYCKIGIDAKIGIGTRILYAKQVSEEATIGKNCIIGGNVADRTVIEDDVTYLGEIAHSHRDPTLDWDATVEESPTIRKGSVIGVNALIIGGRSIGPCSYVGAGEIIRTDVPANSILLGGELRSIASVRGLVKSRCLSE